MKSQLTLVVLALFAAARGLLAQSYSIKWYTIGGAGGSSTGNVYAVAGTIGQYDAGWQSGGVYSMSGGFWSLAGALSADDAPTLCILPGARSVILAWPNSSTGFQLQQSPSLAAPAWTDVRTTPRVLGTELQVAIPIQPGNQFFRLRREETK